MKNKNKKILVLALACILSGSGARPALAEGEPAPAGTEADIPEEVGTAEETDSIEPGSGGMDYEDPVLYEDPPAQQEDAALLQETESTSSEGETTAETGVSEEEAAAETAASEGEVPAETAISEEEEDTESISSVEETDLLPPPVPDPETSEVWEQTFRDVKLTGNYAQDLLAIARTQLGYSQSGTDYILDEDGQPLWYSRYAAWEGLDYGVWNAMFTDFCLCYAGIPLEILPSDLDFMIWIEKLEDLYIEADGTYLPREGDLIFMRQPEEESGGTSAEEALQDPDTEEILPDRCGIVSALSDDRIFVIEGDCQGQVLECSYERGDEHILGYVSMEEVQKRAEEAGMVQEEAQSAEVTKEPETEKKEEDGKGNPDKAAEKEKASSLLYDTNESGQVDINDAQYLYYQVTTAMEDADAVGDLAAFDFNGDGITDLADVRFLSHILSDPEQTGTLRDPAEETESTAVREEKK